MAVWSLQRALVDKKPLWVTSEEKAGTVIRSLYYIYGKITGWEKPGHTAQLLPSP